MPEGLNSRATEAAITGASHDAVFFSRRGRLDIVSGSNMDRGVEIDVVSGQYAVIFANDRALTLHRLRASGERVALSPDVQRVGGLVLDGDGEVLLLNPADMRAPLHHLLDTGTYDVTVIRDIDGRAGRIDVRRKEN
jgi:hypothetical protein